MNIERVKTLLTKLAVDEEVVVVPAKPAVEADEEKGIEAREAVPARTEIRPAIHDTDYAAKGFHLEVSVAPADVVAAAGILDEDGFFLEAVTGVDWIKEGRLEVVYDYSRWEAPFRVVVRTRVDRDAPEVPTISGVMPGANWHERETHDFFGVVFTGHPDLSPLLLPEDADFHPLRKDFSA